MPTVSVIVPNYNHEKYLKERIESILNQSFVDFELILLDDCSRDSSREILKSYKDHPKVKHVILNQENSGSTFLQWKKGLELATGKFVWIAESDDSCSPFFLETLVPVLEADERTVLAFTQSATLDENGNRTGNMSSHTEELNEFNWKEGFVADGKTFLLHAMSFKNAIPNASAVLLRKDSIQHVLEKPVPFKLNGDWFLWIRIISGKKIAFISKELNYFRFHSGTVRSGFRDYKLIATEFQKIQDEILVQTNIRPGPKTRKVLLNGWMYGYFLNNNVSLKSRVQSFFQIMKYSKVSLGEIAGMFVADKLLILKILKAGF